MAQITSKPTSISVKIQPPVPTWVKNMSLLTWKELTGTNPASLGANGVMAFSGGAYDSKRKMFLFFGGGHNDGSDNGVYGARVGIDTPDAVRLITKSPSVQYNVPYYSDGKPTSRHTYGSTIYHPGTDGMMTVGCAAVWGSAPIFGNMDRFNLATNTWDKAGTWTSLISGTEMSGISALVDNAGNIFATSNGFGGILKWTPTPGTYYPGTWEKWTTTSLGSQWWETENALTYDPSRNRIVFFGAGNTAAHFNLSTKAKTPITFTGPAASSAPGKTWTNYCPERDSFFGYVAGTATTILECRASDFYVTTFNVSGTGPAPSTYPTPTSPYNRMRVDTSLGIVMLHNSFETQNLFAFRYK